MPVNPLETGAAPRARNVEATFHSRDDRRARLGAFLKAKRAALRPADFGLPVYKRRRVEGLRREEVALLAGISVTWYTQLESGAPITVSPSLLRRLADVLALSAIERTFLFGLAIDEMGITSSLLAELEILCGPHIAGPSFESEIGIVLRVHRALKAHIYRGLLHNSVDDLASLLDEQRCPIGIWLHDDLSPVYRRSPHYDRAARAHAHFHREIERVVHAGCCGDHPVDDLVLKPGSYVDASVRLEDEFAEWHTVVSLR